MMADMASKKNTKSLARYWGVAVILFALFG